MIYSVCSDDSGCKYTKKYTSSANALKNEAATGSTFLVLAVCSGGDAHDAREDAGEVVGIAHADHVAYLIDPQCSEIKQTARVLDLQLNLIGYGRHAGSPEKERREICGRIAELTRNVSDTQSIADIIIHDPYRVCHNIIAALSVGFRRQHGRKRQQPYTAKEMVEHGTGIQEIFLHISFLKHSHDLLKETHAPSDMVERSAGEADRRFRQAPEQVGGLTFEMHPADGPWSIVVGGINVRLAGGQDEIVARAHIISMTVNLIPASAIDAENEYMLIDRGVAAAVMVARLGVIPDVGHIQLRRVGGLFQQSQRGGREYERTLPLEAILYAEFVSCKHSDRFLPRR